MVCAHVVDQHDHVGNVQLAIAVNVGIPLVDGTGISADDGVDQHDDVGNVHQPVSVHVATQAGVLVCKVARVTGAAVDMGIGLVRRVG